MEKEELSFSQEDFARLKKEIHKSTLIGKGSLAIGVIGILVVLSDIGGIYSVPFFSNSYGFTLGVVGVALLVFILARFQNKKYQQDMREGIKVKRITTIQFKKSFDDDLEIEFAVLDEIIPDLDVSKKIFDMVEKGDACTIEYARHSKYMLNARRNSDNLDLLS